MNTPVQIASPEEAQKLLLDQWLYGSAFVGPDGKRIDPRTVRVYPDGRIEIAEQAQS